ncbi:MAG: hypothetical protein ACR2NA_05090 [Solirubrobacterales bacterium]
MTGLAHRDRRAAAHLLAERLPRLVAVTLVAAILSAVAIVLFAPSTSMWDRLAGLALRVFVAYSMGRHLIRRRLPLYVAHGRTRGQFMQHASLAAAGYSAAAAVVMAGGLRIESAVHRAFDWPHDLAFTHLFEGPEQLWLVGIEFWLLFAVWAVAGALLAVWLRAAEEHLSFFLDLVRIPAAAGIVVLAESAVGTPTAFGLGLAGPLPVAMAVAVCAAVTATGLAMTWVVLRHVRIRATAP